MNRYHVELWRSGQDETHTANIRADNPAEALSKAGKRFVGHSRIGDIQHFPGGDTYHVKYQIGHARSSAVNLGPRYIAHVTPLDDN